MAGTDATIAALSTPPGESGIAVVRVSGPDALNILTETLSSPSPAPDGGRWEHRRIYHGYLIDGRGTVVDEVMCAVMRAPSSYTGEHTVELSCHGGTQVVRRTLEVLYEAGARPAEPGEFTRRAFLNGKIDLIQAEAVADLIHARSELQRHVAQRQLAGAVSDQLDALATGMLGLLGEIEANIDFIEEGIETLDAAAATEMLADQRRQIDQLLESAPLSRPLRDGYRVVLAGPVNAGKSSLFNRIVGEHRAIVTETPGTTRDVLRESIVLGGLIYTFEDTAGLRAVAGDAVEVIGIGRAEEALRQADLVLFVIDPTVRPDASVLEALQRLTGSTTILVANKSDLPAEVEVATIDGIPRDACVVSVSALTGDGLGELMRVVAETVGAERVSRMAAEGVVLNARLAELMRAASQGIDTLAEGLAAGRSLELLAVDAREILARYEEAAGRRFHDQLLDVIFSRFCIGK